MGRGLRELRGAAGLRDGLLPLGRELHDPRLRRHRDGTRLAPARPARGYQWGPDVWGLGLRHVRRHRPTARKAAQTGASGIPILTRARAVMTTHLLVTIHRRSSEGSFGEADRAD